MRLKLLMIGGLLAGLTAAVASAEEPSAVAPPTISVAPAETAVAPETVAPPEPSAPAAVDPPPVAAETPPPDAAPAVAEAPVESPPPAASAPPIAPPAEQAAPPSAGCALVKEGDLAAAERLLVAELAARPDDPELNFCLGVVQNRTAQRAAAATLLRALREEPENPAINYELGLHYYRQGVDAEAIDYFETVLDLAPAGPYAAAAGDYLKKIAVRGRGKAWQLEARVGGQYDSNVLLHGDNQPPVPSWLGPADWRGVAQLRVAAIPWRGEQGQLSVAYGLYQSAHHNLSEFNVTQHQGEVAVSRKLGDTLTISGAYAYESLLLAKEAYDRAHQLMPAVSWRLGSAGVSVVAWRWRSVDFTDSGRFPNNSRYDGRQQTLSWSHLWPVSPRLALLAGYARLSESTREAALDFTADRGQLGVRVQLPLSLLAELGGEYLRRDYDGIDPAFLRRRSDTQQSYNLTLTLPLSQYTSLVLGQQLVYNRSNFAPYDYDRSLSSLFVIARY